MKSVKELKENRTAFIGLTTLYPEEFDLILPVFSELWYKLYKNFTLQRKRRKKIGTPKKILRPFQQQKTNCFLSSAFIRKTLCNNIKG
jgi:hypothetical protein